ncbi:MAG: hypothetical protein AMK75_04755 [Planctomycetes bacterium SM23_65]|nr:MAG: hypothetical protein AMK75_04755 [Planctomycetes bacterium SM23_65]
MRRRVSILGIFTLLLVAAGSAVAGELKFTDHMERLGLADPGYAWHGYHDAIVCADWDADGDVDVLVVVSLHEKGPLGRQGRMYVNLLKETGKLAFEDRTQKLIPDGTQGKIIADSAPVFLDVDADGDLDLSVVSDEHHPLTFINDKGVFRLQGWGFSAQSLTIRDCDADGDLDVLGNDTGNLYLNEGKGKFKHTKSDADPCGHMPRDKVLPTPKGIRVDDEVKARAAEKGHVYYFWRRIDLNGDGQEDYHLGLSQAYGFKVARFYARAGAGYRDITAETGLPTDASIRFVDVDADGNLDAVATSKKTGGVFLGDGKGHFARAHPSDADKVFAITIGGCYTVPQAVVDFDCDGRPDMVTVQPRVGVGSTVLRGQQNGRFELVLKTNATSGQAVADLNNDGLLDVVASGAKGTRGIHVYLNETKAPGHWLAVRLKGHAANPFAVNAVVEAYLPGKLGVADARLARANATPDGLPVHLGLGRLDVVDLRVKLPSGLVAVMKNAETDRPLRFRLPDHMR